MYSTELSIYMKLDLRSVLKSLTQLMNAFKVGCGHQHVAIGIRIATRLAIRLSEHYKRYAMNFRWRKNKQGALSAPCS